MTNAEPLPENDEDFPEPVLENIVYGLGGLLPAHPNGNVIERWYNFGDGRGTILTYDGETGERTNRLDLYGLELEDGIEDTDDAFALFAETLRSKVPTMTSWTRLRTAIDESIAVVDAARNPPPT